MRPGGSSAHPGLGEEQRSRFCGVGGFCVWLGDFGWLVGWGISIGWVFFCFGWGFFEILADFFVRLFFWQRVMALQVLVLSPLISTCTMGGAAGRTHGWRGVCAPGSAGSPVPQPGGDGLGGNMPQVQRSLVFVPLAVQQLGRWGHGDSQPGGRGSLGQGNGHREGSDGATAAVLGAGGPTAHRQRPSLGASYPRGPSASSLGSPSPSSPPCPSPLFLAAVSPHFSAAPAPCWEGWSSHWDVTHRVTSGTPSASRTCRAALRTGTHNVPLVL